MPEHVTIPIIASSTASTNTSVSDDGSTFTYKLNPPLRIPFGAYNAKISLYQASVWYVSPYNITSALANNQWVISTSGGTVSDLDSQTITFPDGLYDLDGLNTRLSIELQKLNLVGDEIVLSGISATEKVFVTFTESTESGVITLDLSDSNFTMDTTLGFGSTDRVSSDGNFEADNKATLNTISSYVVRCTVASSSYSATGNQGAGDLASLVPEDTAIGEELNFEPKNPLPVTLASGGGGTEIGEFTLILLTDKLVKVDTQGETWSVTLVVSYDYDSELPASKKTRLR